jgi:hypothetical protein
LQGSPCHSLMHDVKHACLSLLTPWCYCAPSGVGVESSPCSPLQGGLACKSYCQGTGDSREKSYGGYWAIRRSQLLSPQLARFLPFRLPSPLLLLLFSRKRVQRKSYGQGTGLFCGVSPSPRSPRGSFRSASLHHCRCCCAQRNAAHASLLSFCTSFSQLSRYGLATPSSHDGCCAGAPICRQPVLRTLCFTNNMVNSAPLGVEVRPKPKLSKIRGTEFWKSKITKLFSSSDTIHEC